MEQGLDGISQILQNPQIPVPNHLGFVCSSCNKTLSQPSIFGGSSGKVNCHRCGDCFCTDHCKTKIETDIEYGYKSEMSVCAKCSDELQKIKTQSEQSQGSSKREEM